MHLIRAGDLIVNMDLVAKVERLPSGKVVIHYPMPEPTKAPQRLGQAATPIGKAAAWYPGHYTDELPSGKQTDDFWAAVQSLCR